jgi:hypothetical protein
VEVVIVEREPIGIARIFDELFLIDDHGVAIDRHGPESRDFDLPLVDGLTVGSGDARKGGRRAAMSVGLPGTPGAPQIDDRKAGLAARVILAVRPNPDISSRLSQIDVTDPRNASVIRPTIRRSSCSSARIDSGPLQSYLDLASALRERVPETDYARPRFDDRIYVRPASGAKRTSLAASDRRTRD